MKILDPLSTQRRRQLLVGLAALFVCLLVAFFAVNAEPVQQDPANIGRNTSGTSSADQSSDNGQTLQDPQYASQEPFAAKIYSPPGFFDTLFAYAKLKVRLNWWSWLSTGLVVVAVAAAVGILWWSMPAGALLVNVDNVDPEGNQSKPDDTILAEPEPEFYQQPWFIALMVYCGVGLVLMAFNFVLFLDKSSLPTSVFLNIVAIPVYIGFIPVYAICALVVGLLGTLGRATGLNVILHKILYVILYTLSLPFQLVLVILEFVRILAKMLLSLLTRACLPIDVHVDWERLTRFSTALILMPFNVFDYIKDGAANKINTACDAMMSNQPLIAQLFSKF